jgi:DNA polymerase elongation subunit (family B)
MLIIENKGNLIEMFGRTQLGQLTKKTDNTFRPYFYIKNPKGEFKTITGERVSKIIVNEPKDVFTQRSKYEHYEGDINYTNRYLIDRVNKIDKEPIRVCYLDIEIRQESGFSEISEAKNPITLIGVYDNFTKKYKQFSLKDFEKEGGEGIMLSAFIQYIQTTDPDIIASWFGNGFDFPYLLNRMKNLRVDINRLGRGGYSYIGNGEYSKCKIYGRILFDMLEAYKKHFSSGGRESYSLDYISKYELGKLGGKEKYGGTLDELEIKDYDKFLKYNKRDVELLILLDNQLKMIDFFDEVRRMAFCRFEDVFMNSKTADSLCLKYAKEHNIILPSVTPKESDKYEGGYVIECNPKLYENIVVMDFKSLYPSIMIGFNTSYETLDKNGPINVDDKYIFRKEVGIIPAIVKPLLEKRKIAKKKMIGLDENSPEYKGLNITQNAYKIIANSFYGVLGFKSFRLYNKDVAASITYIARKLIKETIDWFNKNGYEVIYGDTDSVFLQMKDNDIDKIKELNKKVNVYLNEYLSKYIEKENNIFSLDFKEAFAVLFFKRKDNGEGAKKKYAGKLYWKNGIGTKEVSIVGFESGRSDYPKIGRDFMKQILHMVLDKEPPEKVMKFIQDFKDKIRREFTPEQIGLPVSINKPLNKYHNEMHVRAARLANEHGEGIRVGDKIKMVFIKGENNVIAFKEKMPEGYEIDYDNMIRRLVDLKIRPIFASLNWDYDDKVLVKGQRTL